MNASADYVSICRPDFTPFEIDCGKIPAYQYQGNLQTELQSGNLTSATAVALFEDMLIVRALEEMIVELRLGRYEDLPGYDYRGPTHVSIGQEATSVGACSTLTLRDQITSTHRGHADSLAKGAAALRAMSREELVRRIANGKTVDRGELLDMALEDHVYRTIAELFGKDDGYCKGRGGGMHIADFSVGHLGANAIVGGGVPIATGAALALRYRRSHGVVCCFAGDGAFANGVVLEALNFAAQHQFTNARAGPYRHGLPIIFLIINNHYGMTHHTDDEVMGVSNLARRAAGFADDNMHAEIINGMDVLAVRDGMQRAIERCRKGEGPVLLDVSTYRFYGHSLSDPRNEYRTREEEAAWREADPLQAFQRQLLACGVLSEQSLQVLIEKVKKRQVSAAVRAAKAADPDPSDVTRFLYTETQAEQVPLEFQSVKTIHPPQSIKRSNGQITCREAIREALVQEMKRDARVILYGEDVADYGGAFKVTKELLELFGRDRVFNTPISEACICGTAVGAAMVGLRPVVELMYMDFAFMASDQICNQAAKWHYMSGAQVKVPLVIRTSVGGGKGYGGQHSQTLESLFTHIPGLYVVYPSTPYDAKGLLKSSIRNDNPILFIESQLLYGLKGAVPEEEYLVPIGKAAVRQEGSDLTLISWGPAVSDCLKAAAVLEADQIHTEVIDLRSLTPLDLDTILDSVKKTGHCMVVSHAVHRGSFTGEIASTIQEKAFDFLDAPILRVDAQDGIVPQSSVLERVFFPSVDHLVSTARTIL